MLSKDGTGTDLTLNCTAILSVHYRAFSLETKLRGVTLESLNQKEVYDAIDIEAFLEHHGIGQPDFGKTESAGPQDDQS